LTIFDQAPVNVTTIFFIGKYSAHISIVKYSLINISSFLGLSSRIPSHSPPIPLLLRRVPQPRRPHQQNLGNIQVYINSYNK
uniref:Uncharacterized protein n=1 Tax=Salvator merianae TaxID=96440 RepID=A0A8D0BQQ8_SALMN